MHDTATIQPPHGNFHPSDFLAITLSFLPTLFTILNENSGVFVSLAALFGASFTAYRFLTVFTDRRKTHKKEQELNKILDKHIGRKS